MRPALLLVLVCAAGCGQSPSDVSSVLPSNATSIEIDESGGLELTPGAGSTCMPSNASFTYVVATHALSWRMCSSSTPDGVYTFVPGQAMLDDTAAAQLADALNALARPPQPCGSDFHATLVVATASGDTTYDDAECFVGYSDVDDVLYAAAQ